MLKVTFKTDYSRHYPDPLNKHYAPGLFNIEHYVFLCKAKGLPLHIPKDPNPRGQNTDREVYKEVRNSLLSREDLTFHLKNKGITILATSVDLSNDKQTAVITFMEGNGIVDGGHTYKIICENQDECPENQYVKIEVLTGISSQMIDDIAGGLNTAVQVQVMSLANLTGRFKWIEQELSDMPYENQIVYRENTPGTYDVRDVVALLTLFNIEKYSEHSGTHPKLAYTSKKMSLDMYLKDEVSYQKLRPILKDILCLHDYVQIRGRDLYNKKYAGKGAALAFFESRIRGEYEFIFIGEQHKCRLFDGALYPILASFRFLVEQKPGNAVYSWKVGSFENVKKFFDVVGADLINLTKNTSDTRDRNPNAIGKDDNHWDNLYKTVALAYLQGWTHKK